MNRNRLPLAGIRVLDLSRVLAGPFCGQLLGDLGAEVIKVERPGTGDDTRQCGPPFLGDLSAYFLSVNRNKRSVAVDLARAEGREILDGLLRKSDALIENFRPRSAARLGLAPARIENPLATPEGPRDYFDMLFWISFGTLTGCPATTAPVGLTANGLPVGIQILGPYLEDATPIDVAGKITEVVGGYRAPPGYQ